MNTIIMYIEKEIENSKSNLEYLKQQSATNNNHTLSSMLDKFSSKIVVLERLLYEAKSYEQ